MRKISLILVITFWISFANGQSPAGEKVYVKEFKWKIEIPAGFAAVDKERQEAMKKMGKKAMENTAGKELSDNTISIFNYSIVNTASIDANYQVYTGNKDSEKLTRKMGLLMYNTVDQQFRGSGLKLDSISEVKMVDGLKFHAFRIIAMAPNGRTMGVETYTIILSKRLLSVNFAYADEEKAKQLKDAFFNSKFKRRR